MSTINETCGCGATFSASDSSAYLIGIAASKWRETHVHPTSPKPGPCWATAAVLWPNGVVPRCELEAGHAGAHECDRGSMGGTAVWSNDAAVAARPTDTDSTTEDEETSE